MDWGHLEYFLAVARIGSLSGAAKLLRVNHSTVARRLERAVIRLKEHEGEGSVRPIVQVYLNRLSDWLFVLGRWVTSGLGHDEMLWQPLGKRGPESGVANRIRRLYASDEDFEML